MKVLLLNQYFTSSKQEDIYTVFPINLLYLASYLKSKLVDCKIVDLGLLNNEVGHWENCRWRSGKSDWEIIRIIEGYKPDIIGLSCMYSRHYIDVLNIAKLIKKSFPAIKIVIGGNHATTYARYLVNEPSFDYIVTGEGELSLHRIANGVVHDKIVHTEFVKDIDQFVPDYSLINMKSYTMTGKSAPYIMRQPVFGIITSRGCPYNCVYCTVNKVWDRVWRGRDYRSVVDEIELLYYGYGINEIHFLDDNIAVDKQRLINICQEIINRNIDIKWTTPNGIPHWLLDNSLLRLMKKSGCYRLTFGIESGCDRTREFIRKTHSLQQAKGIIKYANSIGMWTVATNIIGFPYETKEEMQETLRFNIESKVDFATFFILAPHVSSDVYEYFYKEGLLDFSKVFSDEQIDMVEYERMNRILDDSGHNTLYLTAKELKDTQSRFYKEFIKHRALSINLLSKVRSMEDLRYTLRILKQGFKILKNSITATTTKGVLYGNS